MPTIDLDIKLDFTDVLLKPKRSELQSRNDVLLEREFFFKHSNRTWSGIPIMVSNMDTIGTLEMALALQKFKVITCLHKYYSVDDILQKLEFLDKDYFAISFGVNISRLEEFMEKINPHFICLDVANGYSTKFLEIIKEVRQKYPKVTIIAGNVVTEEMVLELIISGGADIIKCGIGSGSVCTTRLQTGVGFPQFSAILECANSAHGVNAHIISDGGIQNAGDFGKAFGAGADFVMCGSMFAGHDECNPECFEFDKEGRKYSIFYGMSSSKAMEKHHGGIASYRSAEGKCVKIRHKGKVENTMLDILGGIRSTMTYIGAQKMKHISKCAHFIRVNHQVNTIYNGKEI